MTDSEFDLFARLRAGDVEAVRDAVVADPSRAHARDEAGVSLLMTALYDRHRDLAAVILEHVTELDVFEVAALGRMGDLQSVVGRSHSALTTRS